MNRPTSQFLTAAAAIAALSWLFLIAEYSADHWIGQTMAAWIQALGSIGAIIGAIWISRSDHRARIRAEEESRRKRVEALAVAAAQAVAAISALEYVLKSDEHRESLLEFGFDDYIFDDAITSIDALPMHEFTNGDAVVHMRILKTLLRGSKRRSEICISNLRNGQSLNDGIYKDLSSRTQNAKEAHDLAIQAAA